MTRSNWLRRKSKDLPSRKAVSAAFNSQRPLDAPEKPLARKKPVRRDWDERPELEPVED